jgi:hypothetical protein
MVATTEVLRAFDVGNARNSSKSFGIWSGRRESNPFPKLGKLLVAKGSGRRLHCARCRGLVGHVQREEPDMVTVALR